MARPRDGRQRVEDALVLRISDLVPRQRSAFGFTMSGSLTERDPVTGATTATISYEGEARGAWGRLRVIRTVVGQRWPDPAYQVTLSAKEHPFGGQRWRFTCPDGFGAVSALYLPFGADYFASRHAHRLAYASEGMTPQRRGEAKARRIRVALGGDPDLGAPWPERPRGMHRVTYDRHQTMAAGFGSPAFAAAS